MAEIDEQIHCFQMAISDHDGQERFCVAENDTEEGIYQSNSLFKLWRRIR